MPAGLAPAPAKAEASRAKPSAPKRGAGTVLRALTEAEREARARALVDARGREEEDRRRAEAEAKAKAEREAREKEQRAAADLRKREEEARRRLAGEGPPVHAPSAGAVTPRPTPPRAAETSPSAETKRVVPAPPRRAIVAPAPVPPRPTPSRGGVKDRGRLTVATATAGGDEERVRSHASYVRRNQRLKGRVAEPKEKIAREVILPETITIQELANRMSERAVDVIRLLMKSGEMHKITDVIDADTAQLVAEEMGHTVKRVAESDVEEGLFDTPDTDGDLSSRPAVVTIMGHVDHGKTSLLDAIRHANVVSGEAGGITQHIGAYQVTAPNGAKVTFIDTPGHAAFTAMRARGAKVTDIVVLVVAADDGVMPQTIEAIHHARAAHVPLIVAINKIDKPDAKPERVRTELLQHEVQVESLGGETLEVEVSAKQKLNLDKLLELIALQAEVLDLKANATRSAEGTVIEARLDKGRGPVATVLVQRGTLHVGDLVVAGSQWGRVRALLDDKGVVRPSAGPSFPVEILGFSGTPEAGDRVAVVENEARAREVTEYRERQKREKLAVRGGSARSSLSDMMSQLKTAGRKEFPLVVKGDVQGSVEAILAALEKLNTDEVAARIVHAGVGGISESDISLAEASGAAVIGFNVRAHKEAREACRALGHRNPLLQHHLQSRRRCESGDVRPARADLARDHARQCANPRSVRHHQGRQGRGLPRHRRPGRARRQCAAHPRQCRRARRQVVDAQTLQGRGQGSSGRPGMRHGLRELPGHARRRRDRVLSHRGDQALALKQRLIKRALVQIPWMAAKLSVGVHWRIRQQAPRSTSLARFCSALEAYPMRTGLS